jgi:flagellar motor switch protein FliM
MDKVSIEQGIDPVIRGARTGGAGADSAGPVVQPWDIRQAGQIGSEQLRAINHLHESFARNLTITVGSHLRVVFDCKLVSAEHITFREFLHNIPEKTYIASCDLSPAGATAVLQLDNDIAFPIIDILLGGEGTHSEGAREPTEIEVQVLEGIIRVMFRELQNSWNAIAMEFNFGARQNTLQSERLMPPEEKVLCLRFEIKMSETRGTLNLAVPAVVSNALLRKISSDFSYQRQRVPVEARLRIQKKMLDCFFPVELSLSGLQVPLEALTHLEAGSVLPFCRSASDPAGLLVDNVYLGSAFPVRVNTRRAARLLSLGTPLAVAGEL